MYYVGDVVHQKDTSLIHEAYIKQTYLRPGAPTHFFNQNIGNRNFLFENRTIYGKFNAKNSKYRTDFKTSTSSARFSEMVS